MRPTQQEIDLWWDWFTPMEKELILRGEILPQWYV